MAALSGDTFLALRMFSRNSSPSFIGLNPFFPESQEEGA
jgi:hypothetical protein